MVPQSCWLQPYWQKLGYAGKDCQGEMLRMFENYDLKICWVIIFQRLLLKDIHLIFCNTVAFMGVAF